MKKPLTLIGSLLVLLACSNIEPVVTVEEVVETPEVTEQETDVLLEDNLDDAIEAVGILEELGSETVEE